MKIVREHITENWVSSDTGIDLYSDRPANPMAMNSEEDDVVDQLVPPTDVKIYPKQFVLIVDSLLDIAKSAPELAVAVFQKTIKTHPYILKKPIGFKAESEYEPTINKFLKYISSHKLK